MTDNQSGGAMIVDALQNTCVLAKVAFSALGTGRTDRDTSKEVTTNSGAIKGTARVVVNRLAGADELHKRIIKVQHAAKVALYERSMPYGSEEGWRILPNAELQNTLAQLNGFNTEFKQLLEEVKDKADDIIAAASKNVGTLNVELPTPEELASAYTMTTEFRPIPDGSQFKGLPDSTAAKLAKHVEARTVAAFEKAQQDTLSRVIAPLSFFIERMEVFEKREAELDAGKDPGRHGLFRDSLVTNIQAIANVMKSFNVTNDERFVELSEQIDALLEGLTPNDLRKDKAKRTEAVDKARDIVERMKEWMA